MSFLRHRSLLWLLGLAALIYLMVRPSAFEVANTIDDICYFQGASQVAQYDLKICTSSAYAPGQGWLLAPAALIAQGISKVSSFTFLEIAPTLMGLQTILSFLLLQWLLWQWIRGTSFSTNSLTPPPSYGVAVSLALSFPFLFYATARPLLPTVNEALWTLLFMIACQRQARYVALFCLGSLCLIRWNALPLFAVWAAFFYRDRKASSLALLTMGALAIPAFIIAKEGYNSDTLLDILKNISLDRMYRVFWGSDWGLVWTMPVWLLLIGSGLRQWGQQKLIFSAVLLYILIQLCLVFGWNGNGGFFHYRYLTSSFIISLFFWPGFWNALSSKKRSLVSVLIVLQAAWMTYTTGVFGTTPELSAIMTSDLHAYTKDFQVLALKHLLNLFN